jgi:hypothetical protein
MHPTINVVIDEDGATTVSVEGCAGPACKDLTRAIEQALGTLTEDTHTPDFHRAAPAGQAQGRQQQSGAGAA